MGTNPVPTQPTRSSAEQAFTDALIELVAQIERVQASARVVREAGGDARAAFLVTVPEDQRAALNAQWPMFSMFLGL